MAISKGVFSDLDRKLANYLITLKAGAQLLSSRELAELFGASLGSISSAINHLEEVGAVVINRHGRLGSFLERRSLGTLWSVIENGPMVIAMTLPSYRKCEGLASAIYSLLNGAGVETYLIFVRGSYNRINALRSGHCHAVVISVLAADELAAEDEETALQLPPQSFVTDHCVFFRRSRQDVSNGLTVGVDPDSFDIKYLTELEFADCEVTFHPMTFTQIDLHLEKSFVDAAISNGDHLEMLASKEIASRPLSPRVQAIIGNRDTSAALLIKSAAVHVKTVLKEILDPEAVLAIQQKVVEGEMVPRY